VIILIPLILVLVVFVRPDRSWGRALYSAALLLLAAQLAWVLSFGR
jgi:hypothetical protein